MFNGRPTTQNIIILFTYKNNITLSHSTGFASCTPLGKVVMSITSCHNAPFTAIYLRFLQGSVIYYSRVHDYHSNLDNRTIYHRTFLPDHVQQYHTFCLAEFYYDIPTATQTRVFFNFACRACTEEIKHYLTIAIKLRHVAATGCG